MQQSLWKLAAVVGVSGLGFLVILQVQKGLHDPGMIQAAELDPSTDLASAPAKPGQPPRPLPESENATELASIDSTKDDPFSAASPAGIDFRDSVPPATASDREGQRTAAMTTPSAVAATVESPATADPFAAIRENESGTLPASAESAVVPVGHNAAMRSASAAGPEGEALAQAGDVNDFGPDPFADLPPVTPDADAAGLEDSPASETPSPTEQLDSGDPFGSSPGASESPIPAEEIVPIGASAGDEPATGEPAATTPPANDPFGTAPAAIDTTDPFGTAPADPVSPDATAPQTDDPFGTAPVEPIEDPAAAPAEPASNPESDPFGGDPSGSDPFGGPPPSSMPADELPVDSPAADPLAEPTQPETTVDDPFGEAPALGNAPAIDTAPPMGGAMSADPTGPATNDPATTPQPEMQPAPTERIENGSQPAPQADDPFGLGTPPVQPAPVENQPIDSPRLLPTDGEPAATPGAGTLPSSTPRGPQKAELTVEKKAPDKAVLGEPLVYEIHVTNVGECAANEVTVADVVPKGTNLIGTIPRAVEREGKLFWSLTTMEPGQSKTIKVKVTPFEAGQIGSVATVNFVSEVAAATNIVAPHLALRVSAPPQVTVGQPVDFRFEIMNEGSAPAEKVVLRDLLPPGFEHADGNDLEYEVGTLPPGATEAVTLRVASVKAGSFKNEAIVTAAGGIRTTATADVAVASSAVTVSRRGPKQRHAGRPATYHNVVRNGSDRAARSVTVIESVPEGMDFVSASHSGQFDPDRRTVAWQIDSLPPGDEQTLQVVLTAAAEGIQDSTVRVEVDQNAPIEVTSTTTVAGQPDLSPSLQGLDQPIAVGERAAFRIRVRNRGNADANGVTVGVSLPKHLKLVDVRGGSVQTDDAGRALVQLAQPVPAEGEQAVDFVIESSAPGATTFRAEVNAPYLSSPLIKDQKLTVVAAQTR